MTIIYRCAVAFLLLTVSYLNSVLADPSVCSDEQKKQLPSVTFSCKDRPDLDPEMFWGDDNYSLRGVGCPSPQKKVPTVISPSRWINDGAIICIYGETGWMQVFYRAGQSSPYRPTNNHQ